MKEEDYSKAIEVFSGSPWEAEIIKGLLESNNIRCVITVSYTHLPFMKFIHVVLGNATCFRVAVISLIVFTGHQR